MATERDRAYVWLSMSEGLGPRKIEKLFAYCSDAQALMGMGIGDWSPCVGAAVAANMRDAREKVDDALEALERGGMRVISRENPEYPEHLLAIHDPPVALYAKGTMPLRKERFISMVGSRRCTRYGREAANQLAGDLAREGAVVVSGLARGIDTACHIGALEAGGETMAVLGCGIDVVYPPENGALYERIAQNGALVSEYLPGVRPFASHFPLRNRIIAGVSMGLVLVEAAAGSGAMITVEYALDHGRTIFAVPGNITSSQSVEPNRLLRDGAVLTTCALDVLFEMGWQPLARREADAGDAVQLSLQEAAVVAAAGDEEITFEELLAATGMDVPSLNSLLTMMRARGIMKQSAGKVFWVNRRNGC